MSEFSLELSQNKYLSTSDSHLHAVLTVRATGADPQRARPSAEVLLVDCSSSMDWPPTKIANARWAAAEAIDTLRDGTRFALVEGTGKARVLFPERAELVPANPDTRAAAKEVAARLIASGATAMSTWLTLARELLDRHPDAVRHALLLTDGRNESEPARRLDRVLHACEGHFTCDARGIGDDWEPDDLRRIAGALRGTADAVLEDTELTEDFRRIIQSSMGKTVPDLTLRIVTPPFARVEFLRQVMPADIALTDRRPDDGDRAGFEVSTGAWGNETREYHLCLAVDLHGRPWFEDLQVGRVELVAAGEDVRVPEHPVPVFGHLTDDESLSAWIDDRVAHYTVHADLGRHIQAGWARFGEDDRDGAAAEWGPALRLATQLGADEVVRRLERLVDVEDAERGTVRVKDSVRQRDGFSLLLSMVSGVTTPPKAQHAEESSRSCPKCTRLSPAFAVLCMNCGHPFAPGAGR